MPPASFAATGAITKVILEREHRGGFQIHPCRRKTVSLLPPAPCRGHERPARWLPPA
jgi:hypothetical protein